VALDEAYLDVTWNKQDIPFGHRVARLLKADIRQHLALTASAGVAPCKFIAKIASDLDKPDGLVTVMPHQVQDFLQPLPVERIPGVGRVTRGRLADLGVVTIGDLATVPAADLVARFGVRGAILHRRARGVDEEPVTPEQDPKQLSSETTFATDVYTVEDMRHALRDLAHEVAGRLGRRRLRGRVVTLKARYPDFETVTRSLTGGLYLDTPEPIYRIAADLLLRTAAPTRGVRLLGVGVSGFDDEARSIQLDLFAAPAPAPP